MFKKVFPLLFLLSQGLASPAQTPMKKLEQAFNTLLEDPQSKYAVTSLCVLDANSGQTLFAKNENIGMATASTLKTITSATALAVLGKDFQYQTTLAYSGTIDAMGVLHGHIVIIGGGDPTLGSWRYETSKEGYVLNQWVSAIKQAGIKKIEGGIIGDDGLWGTQTTPEGWVWQDIGNYYGAGASALSWRENQFDFHLKANRTDNRVSILKTAPAMPYLKVVNEMKPGAEGTGDKVYAFLPPLSGIAYLRGTWALGISKSGISAALPDPAFDAAFRLQDTLRRVGIPASAEPNTTRQLKADQQALPVISQKLNTISSPVLSQIIYWFNKKSVNLYGEHLLKTLAEKSGKEGTTKNGASFVINYWAGKGIDRNALNIIDGSGLSPGTRVTTAAMAEILYRSQKESWFPVYYASFPENSGMKLKSGTINDVSAFAGYHTDPSGRKYIIVICINNYSGSGINKKLFKVLDALK
ncbi:MAG TPA: D-alanyl-D-alanine carboxypeptidase/D-alanyl-D-alanine-endopeptidase [Pedobacter sp.]|nr:D-alanyl-D-alanine carboxypeptidase/D-alanyl-D-alanine-endopeptidase [Pedobacter sp.]